MCALNEILLSIMCTSRFAWMCVCICADGKYLPFNINPDSLDNLLVFLPV